MEGGEGGDFGEEFLDVELGLGEGFLEVVEGVLTVGGGGLFDGVMEELADEGAVAVGGLDDVIDDVARAGEADFFVFVDGEVGGGVDGFVLVLGAPAADGVEVFEGEAEGVDEGVAGHAVAVAGEFGDFFAHGEAGFEVAFFEGDGHGRGLQGEADDVAGEEDAAMDGGGGAGVGEGGEEVGVGDDASALFGVEGDALEVGCLDVFAVDFGEA